MQVFTSCKENYAKSMGAHTALSEIEQHELDALITSESFNWETWLSVEGQDLPLWRKKTLIFCDCTKKLFWFYLTMMENDQKDINFAFVCL